MIGPGSDKNTKNAFSQKAPNRIGWFLVYPLPVMSSTTVPNPANGSFPSRSSRLSAGWIIWVGQSTTVSMKDPRERKWKLHDWNIVSPPPPLSLGNITLTGRDVFYKMSKAAQKQISIRSTCSNTKRVYTSKGCLGWIHRNLGQYLEMNVSMNILILLKKLFWDTIISFSCEASVSTQ